VHTASIGCFVSPPRCRQGGYICTTPHGLDSLTLPLLSNTNEARRPRSSVFHSVVFSSCTVFHHISAFKLEAHLSVLRLCIRSSCCKAMRPEKVSSWREQLPPPFNKPRPVIRRRASVDDLTKSGGDELEDSDSGARRRRRNSTSGALDRVDRRVNWLRFIHEQYRKRRCEDSSLAIEKLRR
jgi:hypothetical protein